MKLRTMTEADLEGVNRLWSEALDQGPDGPSVPELPRREPSLVALRRAAHPEGAFVAETEEGVVGCVFSCLWGRTGWLGPLVVGPRAQGRGFGTQLLEAAVEALQGADATVIGVESPPEDARTVGFLARRGFRLTPPTLELERATDDEGYEEVGVEPTYYSALLEEDRSRFLEDVRRLSASLDADLDYRREVELTEAHGMGDSLLLRRGEQPVGLAVCHTRPWAEEGELDLLRVAVLALDETDPFPSLDALLGMVRMLAGEARAERIRLPLPSRSWEAARLLFERGYRVVGGRLRSTLLGYPDRGEAGRINLARWAG